MGGFFAPGKETVQRFTSKDEGAHWIPGRVILKTDGEQKFKCPVLLKLIPIAVFGNLRQGG